MAYLRSLDDQTQIPIEEGENLLVGRLNKCDVVIEDASVSSQHARLHLLDSVLRVVDVGSTNGTRVNYTNLIKPGVLLDGDVVEFGNVSFSVDGPELRPEKPESSPDWSEDSYKPLEASQKLDATMNIQVPDEEDDGPDVEVDLEPVESDEEEDLPEGETTGADPLLLGTVVSAAILLLAGFFLVLFFMTRVPPGA